MVSAIHQYESAIGTHVSPPPRSPPYLPPHPIPPGCHRVLALGTQGLISNSHCYLFYIW